MQAILSLPNSILPFTSNVTHSVVAPFSLAGLPPMGSSLAKIAIVEFTDYQCPFCKQYFGTTYKKVKENFVDQGIARYYIADFPLENHNFAFPAAIAAQCAFGQDMFWEYHDRLFGLERGITSESFTEVARSPNINLSVFEDCMSNSQVIKSQVESSLNLAVSLGVSGTPTFLIGKLDKEERLVDGVLLRGARPFSSFQEIVSLLRF